MANQVPHTNQWDVAASPVDCPASQVCRSLSSRRTIKLGSWTMFSSLRLGVRVVRGLTREPRRRPSAPELLGLSQRLRGRPPLKALCRGFGPLFYILLGPGCVLGFGSQKSGGPKMDQNSRALIISTPTKRISDDRKPYGSQRIPAIYVKSRHSYFVSC